MNVAGINKTVTGAQHSLPRVEKNLNAFLTESDPCLPCGCRVKAGASFVKSILPHLL